MKKHVLGGLAVIALCGLAVLAGAREAAAEPAFTATLMPNKAVFPGKTSARGKAKLRLSADGRALHYEVDVFDVGTVSQIHIHLGEVGTTPEGEHFHLLPQDGHGETVGFLLNYTPEGRTANGTVAKGTLTAADLMGTLKGQPLKVLVDHMRKEWAYVNVHIVQKFDKGRRFCCPSGVRGFVRQD